LDQSDIAPAKAQKFASSEAEYDLEVVPSGSVADYQAPPAAWNRLFSSSSSSHALSVDDEIDCTQWAIRHLAYSLRTSTELASWALLAHSGIYSRAQLHLRLVLAAANVSSLESLPREDARSLFLIDSLAWSSADDEIVLNGSLDDLRERRGEHELNLRIRFLTSAEE
jgi:hypothetical protein